MASPSRGSYTAQARLLHEVRRFDRGRLAAAETHVTRLDGTTAVEPKAARAADRRRRSHGSHGAGDGPAEERRGSGAGATPSPRAEGGRGGLAVSPVDSPVVCGSMVLPSPPRAMAAEAWKAYQASDAAAGRPGEDAGVHRVIQGLYLGGIGGAKRFPALQEHGVTHVLNCSPMVPCFHKDKLTYLHLEVFDETGEDIARHFPRANAFIAAGLEAGGVYVHCYAGASRSAALVMAYLISEKGMDLEDALFLAKAARPAVKPNEGFLEQLDNYARALGREGWGGEDIFDLELPGGEAPVVELSEDLIDLECFTNPIGSPRRG